MPKRLHNQLNCSHAKMTSLHQWCADATHASQSEGGPAYRFVYVDQEGYERNPPTNFATLVGGASETTSYGWEIGA